MRRYSVGYIWLVLFIGVTFFVGRVFAWASSHGGGPIVQGLADGLTCFSGLLAWGFFFGWVVLTVAQNREG